MLVLLHSVKVEPSTVVIQVLTEVGDMVLKVGLPEEMV